MKIRIEPEFLTSHLQKGEVSFLFEKLDGTLRESKGTTSPHILGEVKKGNPPGDALPFFDLDKNQWRSVAQGQKMYFETEWLREIYGCPQLTDEEILFMGSERGYLKDEWYSLLIEVIKNAPDSEMLNFRMCYQDLSSTIWKWQTDPSYHDHLESQWEKMEKIIRGE